MLGRGSSNREGTGLQELCSVALPSKEAVSSVSIPRRHYRDLAYGLSKIILFCRFFYIVPVEAFALPCVDLQVTELSVVALILAN
jgi:hypothetical protein